jgi:hypothetical protein
MESQDEPTRTDIGEIERDIRDARSIVDWYFGDLIEEVARERPVSDEQLLTALTRIELEARARRNQLESRADAVPTLGAPGEVFATPMGTWEVMARAHDLTQAEDRAVRDVHRTMARSIADPPEDDDLVPLVSPAEPDPFD